MVVDGHRHFTRGKSEARVLLDELESDNIEKTVLFGYHGLSFGGSEHAQDVDIAALAAKEGARILPFFCDFDLYDKGAIGYIEKCLGRDGFMGMGEILVYHSPIRALSFAERSMLDPRALECFRAVGSFGKPVLFHADLEFRNDAEKAVSLCPSTNFIWAHTAYDFCQVYGGAAADPSYVEGLLEKHGNLFFDISMWKISPLYFFERAWIDILERHPDRFVFGSDMTDDFSLERLWLPTYWELAKRLGPDVRREVFGGTILRLSQSSR